jgi:hypothetical protein
LAIKLVLVIKKGELRDFATEVAKNLFLLILAFSLGHLLVFTEDSVLVIVIARYMFKA